MAPDSRYDVLVADLRHLGRSLPGSAPSPSLPSAVLARVGELPAPAPTSWARRQADRLGGWLALGRRRVLVAAVTVLVALIATPPVRAAVSDWFGFAGVVVRDNPSPGPSSSAPDPPPAGSGLGLERAAALVGFSPLVPVELGRPDGVEVSADRRVLSMSWRDPAGRTIRADEFDGVLDYAVAKSASGVQFTEVAGDFALWFDRPHDVVWLDADGSPRTASARLAGNTLIWVHGATTVRLEGAFGLARARAIAESVAPLR